MVGVMKSPLRYALNGMTKKSIATDLDLYRRMRLGRMLFR